MSDLPPPPPGFSIVGQSRKPKKRSDIPDPPPGFRLVDPDAHDGDTIDSENERPVRLWGVDAPELDQPGFDRQGNPVQIGRQSRDWLQGEIANAGSVNLDSVQGHSYGRLVGPVELDGTDAGLAALRTGNALVAPQYLSSDPGRRADYVQAERLARVNRLGMHDTFAQDPAEYRANPDFLPERETVAQFFDTPSPDGLPPKVEEQYQVLLQHGTADEINAFLDRQGYQTSRPDDLRAWVKDRDERKGRGEPINPLVSYTDAPPLMIDSGDGAGGAAVRKFGSGFLAGGLDEAGAIVDTLGGTGGRENIFNSDRRLADIWLNNQRQNAGTLSYDQTVHPVASTAGEIAGALTSGFVLPYGQGARTVPQLARVGAVYGGAEGFLGTDGSTVDRVKGAVIGAPVGAVVNAAGGKALEYSLPALGRGVDALRGRFRREVSPEAITAGETAGEAGLDYTDVAARNAASSIPEPPPGFRIVEGGSEGQRVESVAPAPDGGPTGRSIAMEGQTTPSLSANAPQRARRLFDPATDAERMAAAERVQPGDVLPLPSNVVDGPEDAAAVQAGRYAKAKAPNERAELSKGTVRNWMGVSVPKVGPTDLIGWVRLRGGLQDQGGELSAMGFTNASRKGLDHVGQEHRFGPLVNNEGGDNLDDAAMAAWEAGYFPEMTERPTVPEFLDALRDTYEGNTGRRFLPEDAPQLERFDATRSERYDFEQQRIEADGAIWEDRSNPAPEGQPFPPVQAYEEWPSDAIERVGNVDVTKLDSPQDIRRALKTAHNTLGGFDAATRGRITQAETERLASEMGMTADQLLSRRKGQALNAEEALAARQILAKSSNELVNAAKKIRALEVPGDDVMAEFRRKLVRHVAIQEQVAGMTAEAGRTLQQFRMAADSRAVRGDVLAGLVRGGGGRDNLREAAETLIDAVESGPGVFNALANKATKPKWRNKIAELYINFLLSNPATHVVNMTSNTLTAMAQLPEFAAASAIGKARQAFAKGGIDRVTGSEVGARAFGLMAGAKEGARMFARAVRTGEASDFVSKVEGDEYKAISGLKGEVIRVPTRLLTAEDELFKGMARRMELNGIAARQAHKEGLKGEAARKRIAELSANPTDELLEQSLKYGRYLTFQTKLGPIGQSISNVSQNSLIAKLYLPFIRTPTNLLKFAAERSPAAPFMPRWRKEIAAGGARRDVALARMMVGTGFGMAIYQAALNGHVTGALPSDAKKARLLRADGWQEYSIKIGDTYYSYKRLDPFAMTLGVAADLATLPEGMSEREKDDKAALLVMSIMGNLASKTWLSGVSDLVAGLDDPQRNADNMIERLVGSLTVPAGVAGVARAIDPTARQVESVQDAIMARTPGMRDDLLPRRDIWGEEVTFDSGFLSPAYTSKAKRDPVNLELLKLGEYAPGFVPKKVGGRELTPEEHDTYQERAGKLSHERLTYLVTGPGWSAPDREERTKLAKKTVDVARREVRESLFGGGPDKPDGGAPPPPQGFKVVGESAGVNVYRDLQEKIPGVQFTSGFRDYEYNQSLKRRGYNAADDSTHMNGDTFDALPPEGKSMGWLRAQVKRNYPEAETLIHDGHLHFRIPGYYGAPPIGGAASAGVRNPLAGMPPPPPGFTVQ
ncbi:thermonuclease family protein [Tsuneonella sp. YG55]|uniref:Thermonuclease family protein n=1 Tax=Tsuneonella litorea TaxID=2976475 RepID=A0A9X3A9S1_9SPHN|nr:thermonuclease family protein [Tsuneonella litorea]MCT2559230.1 thermonuclease family protein [Tsuneonella litorea]